MDSKELQELRRAVAGVEGDGRGRRYPTALRQRILTYCMRRLDEDISLGQVAAELGVSSPTLERWRAALPSTLSLREVAIVPESSRARLVVHGPSGLRIEGLDVETLASLLRRLS